MIYDQWIGLIPAAGKGIRLGLPYPKELYPIIRNNRYKPVSQFVLENLVIAGIQQIIFVINETKSQLLGYFGNGSRFNCTISYVVQEINETQFQSTSPGLAHALDFAYHLTYGKNVVFGMADTIIQPRDVFQRAMLALKPDDDGILCLFPTDHPEKFGMVRRENEFVTEIVDKPQQTQLTHMWGCIIWRAKFTEFMHEAINKENIYDFAFILNNAINSGFRFRGLSLSDGNYIDLGTYEEIMELDQHLRLD